MTDDKRIEVAKRIQEEVRPILVGVTDSEIPDLVQFLSQCGCEKAESAHDIGRILHTGMRVQFRYRRDQSEYLFDLVTQYCARQGRLDLVESSTLECETFTFDPVLTALVIVMSVSELRDWERRYPGIEMYVARCL